MWTNLIASTFIAAALLALAWLVWRVGRRSAAARPAWLAVVTVLVLAASAPAGFAGYLGFRLILGQPSPTSYPLGPGVTYQRRVYADPRLIVLHVVTVDLTRGPRFRVTPPYNAPAAPRTAATRTTDALRTLHADLAINASYFIPFADHGPLFFVPSPGQRTEAIGPAVGDGVPYGRGGDGWFTLTIDADGRPAIGAVHSDTRQAVSGKYLLLAGGRPMTFVRDTPYPRTAVGFDEARTTMWIVVVDGKQPRYSDGVTLRELTALFIEFGADYALNLDGGGSSTLAANGRLLSRPCHNHVPGRQRPVSNHLAIEFADAPG